MTEKVNDCPGRKKKEVLETFDRAIDSIEDM